jgi:hypothetical protein
MPQCEVMSYHGWQECLRLSGGNWELIATTQVGPRLVIIMHTGHILAEGTLNALQTRAQMEGSTQEEVFLRLTEGAEWATPSTAGI